MKQVLSNNAKTPFISVKPLKMSKKKSPANLDIGRSYKQQLAWDCAKMTDRVISQLSTCKKAAQTLAVSAQKTKINNQYDEASKFGFSPSYATKQMNADSQPSRPKIV